MGAPSTFISGIDKARAGIAMQAEPHRNTPAYVQAYAPTVDFLDCGDVKYKHLNVCVPTGCYDDVMVIDEFNPLEPPSAGHQRKFYSAGTGLIKVTAVGGEDQEFMDLVKITRLTSAVLDRINTRALELDSRGYTVSKDVYAKTPRAVVRTPPRGPCPEGQNLVTDKADGLADADNEELRPGLPAGALRCPPPCPAGRSVAAPT